MTRTQAIERYFNHGKRHKVTIQRLMDWDETKTARENMKLVGFVMDTLANQFARKYGLKFKRVYKKQKGK